MSSEVHTYPDDRLEDAQLPEKDSEQFESDPYIDEYEEEDDARYDEYRTLSIAAVTSLIFGVISLPLVLPWFAVVGIFLIVPAMGLLLGLYSTWTITSRPEEFTGKRLALTGLGLSALMLVIGGGLNYHLNKIEVPPEYVGSEVAFAELQSEKDIDMNFLMQMRGRNVELPLPEKAKQLDGQKVFITGYVYPGDQKVGLDKFVLVPDMGQCCFGGQPKLTDMIEVKLAEPLRIDYSMRRRGIGGTLRVYRNIQARDKLTGVIYRLEADYLSEGPGVTGSADSS